MAQLDPSIIMRAGQYPRRDPLETHANVLAIRGQERKNQLEEAKWQDAQRQRAAQEQQRAAIQGAYNSETGDFDKRRLKNAFVGSGDWESALGVDEREQKRLKGELDAEGKRLEVTAKRMENLGRILQSVTDQPSYDRAIQRMRSMGMDTADIPPQYDPQDVRENIQASMTAAQQMRLKLSERQTVASETRARAASEGKLGTTIHMPGSGPQTVPADKQVRKEAQQGLQSGWETVGRLERIRDTFLPEYLTYKGQLKSVFGGVADKAGISSPEQRKYIAGRRVFTQNVNREFNAYRKEITGAAAAVAELEALKKATLNEDLGPAEFEAAFNEYVSEIRRSMRIKARLLREGVRVGTDEFGQRFDRMYLTGDDDDIAARAAELEAQGLDEAAGVSRLKAEGYL